MFLLNNLITKPRAEVVLAVHKDPPQSHTSEKELHAQQARIFLPKVAMTSKTSLDSIGG